jgi:hypothetical protein
MDFVAYHHRTGADRQGRFDTLGPRWNRSDIAENGNDGWCDFSELLEAARKTKGSTTDRFPASGMSLSGR